MDEDNEITATFAPPYDHARHAALDLAMARWRGEGPTNDDIISTAAAFLTFMEHRADAATTADVGGPQYGAIVVRDEGLRLVEAPKYGVLSLEALVFNAGSDGRGIVVHGGLIHFGDDESYRIVGWEPDEAVLLLERIDG